MSNNNTEHAQIAAAHADWEAYCRWLEDHLVAHEGPANKGHAVSVFERCRRCRSDRLFVTTRQIRRADEAATEFRICEACGHTTRHNG